MEKQSLAAKLKAMIHARRQQFHVPEWGEIPPEDWQCPWTRCIHGMGLAGHYCCPGDPAVANCPHFKHELSNIPSTGDKSCR